MPDIKRKKEWEYIERVNPKFEDREALLQDGWKINSVINDTHGKMYLFERKYIIKNCDSCGAASISGWKSCLGCEDFSNWYQKLQTING